mmetsp:Transcript_56308/g.89422  ORF Transcript_56308/g.89422 Transcript_56308/m.89422 type:complete len:221 (-) Transcript_56308:42-704(-)
MLCPRSIHFFASLAWFVVAFAEKVVPATLGTRSTSSRIASRLGRRRTDVAGTISVSAREAPKNANSSVAVVPPRINQSPLQSMMVASISSGFTRFGSGDSLSGSAFAESQGSGFLHQFLRLPTVNQDKDLPEDTPSFRVIVSRLRIIELFILMFLMSSAIVVAACASRIKPPPKSPEDPVGYLFKLQQLEAQRKTQEAAFASLCEKGRLYAEESRYSMRH